MICQQNVAVPRPWSIPKMRHPGGLNGWGLIGSPYLALEPISASRMMYTSLNSCRQLQLPPSIQASREPPRALPSCACTVHVYRKGRVLPTVVMYLLASVTYHPTDKGVPGQTLMCKHACAIVFVCSLAFLPAPACLPLISTELVERGHFCISGQLHRIQKDIRAPPPPSSV